MFNLRVIAVSRGSHILLVYDFQTTACCNSGKYFFLFYKKIGKFKTRVGIDTNITLSIFPQSFTTLSKTFLQNPLFKLPNIKSIA